MTTDELVSPIDRDCKSMCLYDFCFADCTKSDCRYIWPSGRTYRPVSGVVRVRSENNAVSQI